MTTDGEQPRSGIEHRLRRTLTAVADGYEHPTRTDLIDLSPPRERPAPVRSRRRSAVAALAAAVLVVVGTIAVAGRTDTVVDSASTSDGIHREGGIDRKPETSRPGTNVPEQDPSIWALDVTATPPDGYLESTTQSQSIDDPPDPRAPEAEVGFADLVYPHANTRRTWANGSDVFEAFSIRTALDLTPLISLPGAEVYEVARPDGPLPAVLFTEGDMVHIVWKESPTVLAGLRATSLERSQLLDLAWHVRVTPRSGERGGDVSTEPRTVLVLNGSDRCGIAGSFIDSLRGQSFVSDDGLELLAPANAWELVEQSKVYAEPASVASAERIASLLQPEAQVHDLTPATLDRVRAMGEGLEPEIVVLLGADQPPSQAC